MSKFTIINLPAAPTGGSNEANVTEMMIKRAGITDANTEQMLISKASLLSRLFPTAQDKIIADFKTKAAKQVADFNLRICKLGHEFQMAALTERFNAALSVYKGFLRADVVKVALQKFKEVQQNLNEYQLNGVKEIETASHNCAMIAVDKACNKTEYDLLTKLKQKYEDAIMKQVDAMFLFHENSIKEFVSFLSEKLNIPESFFNE